MQGCQDGVILLNRPKNHEIVSWEVLLLFHCYKKKNRLLWIVCFYAFTAPKTVTLIIAHYIIAVIVCSLWMVRWDNTHTHTLNDVLQWPESVRPSPPLHCLILPLTSKRPVKCFLYLFPSCLHSVSLQLPTFVWLHWQRKYVGFINCWPVVSIWNSCSLAKVCGKNSRFGSAFTWKKKWRRWFK